MNKKSNQKIIIISLFAVLAICACGSITFAERGLEIDYPEVPGAEAPTEETELPGYIKYIFNFSVMIGGILAFAVLLFGGIRWMTSIGNPAAISDARSWMLGGIMGLVLLLSSYLILTAINPDLAFIQKMPSLEPTFGIYLIDKEGNKKHIPDSATSIKNFEAEKIEFITSPDELTSVFIFANEKYKAGSADEIERIKNEAGSIGLTQGFAPKSIYFFENKPGIYLYKKIDFCENASGEYTCLEWPKYLSGSTKNLDEWRGTEVKSLKFKNKEDTHYAAVLFTKKDYKGDCSFIYMDLANLSSARPATPAEHINGSGGCFHNLLTALSSLKLVNIRKGEGPEETVTFYDMQSCDQTGNKKTFNLSGLKDPNYNLIAFYHLIPKGTSKTKTCFISGTRSGDHCQFEKIDIETSAKPPLKDKILSYDIDGNFEVIPYNEEELKGQCRYFVPDETGGNICVKTIVGSDLHSFWYGSQIKSILIIPKPY